MVVFPKAAVDVLTQNPRASCFTITRRAIKNWSGKSGRAMRLTGRQKRSTSEQERPGIISGGGGGGEGGGVRSW